MSLYALDPPTRIHQQRFHEDIQVFRRVHGPIWDKLVAEKPALVEDAFRCVEDIKVHRPCYCDQLSMLTRVLQGSLKEDPTSYQQFLDMMTGSDAELQRRIFYGDHAELDASDASSTPGSPNYCPDLNTKVEEYVQTFVNMVEVRCSAPSGSRLLVSPTNFHLLLETLFIYS